jgi:proline dehydrogenase
MVGPSFDGAPRWAADQDTPMLRTTLIKASDSALLRGQVMRRSISRRIAYRFVAGETLDDGLATTRALARSGRSVTLDYLGEAVSTEGEARSAAKVYREALDRIGEEALPCGVSVKPTQMGLDFAPDLCAELLAEIVAAAERLPDTADAGEAPGHDAHVTLDMEGSGVTEQTVALVESLWAAGHRQVGCAVQTYLHRTPGDLARLSSLDPGGASLRLCKGAYAEPPAIAHQAKGDVDRAYRECADQLLQHGRYPRFATHDDAIIDHIRNRAAQLGLERSAFELQMLYGIRTSLQEALVRDGYRMRVYVPFGGQWYPYFMRRLAERPANLVFFLRSLRDT